MINFFLALLAPIKPKPHPAIGRLFCKVDMRGCMGETRGKELWGVVVEFERGRCLKGKIYDGHASTKAREAMMLQGQDDWILVHYSDGSRNWEPLWWIFDRGDYLEYQT
jgi:hypothetical protein